MNHPRSHLTAEETQSLDRVRRRVAAIVFFVVAAHGVFGLIGVGEVIASQGRVNDARILVVLSGVVGILTVAVTRLLLGRRPVTPVWLALSLVPTVIGWFWIF